MHLPIRSRPPRGTTVLASVFTTITIAALLAPAPAVAGAQDAQPVQHEEGAHFLAAQRDAIILMDSTATPESMRSQTEATAAMFRSFTQDQMAAQAWLATEGGR